MYCEYTITIDKNNVKWITSNMGLVSFDDKEWKLYTPSNSAIPDFFINKVAVDKNNNKWIATQSGLVKMK
jgi:ligand-binding sensor domain-containing protein